MPSPLLRLVDGLKNAVTGMGTGRDPRMATHYGHTRRLTQYDLAAAYRGSGLLRKIVNIPALDMVREWRDWEAKAEQIAAIEAEEKRLCIIHKVHRAEVLRACGGGALVMGLPGDPAQPAPSSIVKGGLAFVNVVSRWHLTFQALNDDATAEGFGEPLMWRMSTTRGQVNIHPSRVIPFRAAPVPEMAVEADAADHYWGESVIEQVLDAVQDSDTARASFAALLHKARLLRIGIPDLMALVSTTDGETNVMKRLAILAQAESLHNATIYDAGNGSSNPGETIDDVTYTFAGAKDVLNAYAEFVCAVSDIPATRLLGRAPEGMNASGNSQQQDWSKKIKAKQELELQPCLDRLDAYLVPSAIGASADSVEWDFAELDDADEVAEATRFKTTMDAINVLVTTGTVPDQALAEATQNTIVENGWMPGLEQALEKIPEADRFGIAADPAADPFANPDGNQNGGDPKSAGASGDPTSPPLRRAANDARPGDEPGAE